MNWLRKAKDNLLDRMVNSIINLMETEDLKEISSNRIDDVLADWVYDIKKEVIKTLKNRNIKIIE